MPPWISLEERLLVPEARSPRSRRSTRSPRSAASLATAAPWMPPPTTRRSYVIGVPPLSHHALRTAAPARDSRGAAGSSPASSLCWPSACARHAIRGNDDRPQGTLGARHGSDERVWAGHGPCDRVAGLSCRDHGTPRGPAPGGRERDTRSTPRRGTSAP